MPLIPLEGFTSPQLVAIGIFLLTYFFIATGHRERTIAAMVGAAAMFAFGILTEKEMISYVDFQAVGLLFGMMVVVGVLREAQFFRWLGIHLTNLCGCSPARMLIALTVMTAMLSAFLDNVTTVLFMVSMTVEIVQMLNVDPRPYVMSEILAANIGGTATLIGSPPNIMIATATGIGFKEFIGNVAPVTVAGLALTSTFIFYVFRRQVRVESGLKKLPVKPSEVISDTRLFRIGVGLFVSMIALFALHEQLGVRPSTVAILGAIALLFIGGPKMPEILEDVEWSTLLFLAALFIVVGGLEKTGALGIMAGRLSYAVGQSSAIAITAILWISALISAIVDDVPIAAALIPVIKDLLGAGAIQPNPLWWALALGTGLGGNGTTIGSPANVVATGIAAKLGVRFSFADFLKIGIPTLLITVGAANLILLLRFA